MSLVWWDARKERVLALGYRKRRQCHEKDKKVTF